MLSAVLCLLCAHYAVCCSMLSTSCSLVKEAGANVSQVGDDACLPLHIFDAHRSPVFAFGPCAMLSEGAWC
jgi:hypothetical protein